MKKVIRLISLAMLSPVFILSSCSSDEPAGSDNPDKPVSPEDTIPIPDDWEITNSLDLSQDEKTQLGKINDFCDDMVDKCAEVSPTGEFSLSPLGMSVYLGMLANSSAGDTHDQILKAFDSQEIKVLNSVFNKLLHHIPSTYAGIQTQMNNGIWIAKKYQPMGIGSLVDDGGYSYKMKENFNAKVSYVDFNGDETWKNINSWAKTATNGVFNPLIPTQMWSSLYNINMFAVNTVYFQGKWLREFDPQNTIDSTFQTPTGKISVKMMRMSSERMIYGYDDDVQLFCIPIVSLHTNLEIFIPNKVMNGKDMAKLITAERRKKLRAQQYFPVVYSIKLPRFESNSNTDMKEVLKLMGINSLDNVDLTPMGIDAKESLPVFHETRFRVNEQGAEMSSATYGWSGDNGKRPEYVEMNIDRPFMYTLRSLKDGTILLAGIVERP